jgi:hypothetical protein
MSHLTNYSPRAYSFPKSERNPLFETEQKIDKHQKYGETSPASYRIPDFIVI